MATFTPGEVSKLLDIPSSTLRRYVAHFSAYLGPEARRQRSRRFTERDISIVAQIRDLAGQGINLEDIPKHLDQTIDVNAARPAGEEVTALALPGFIKRLESIAQAFSRQQEEINQLQERLADTASRAQIESLQKQITDLEAELQRERSKPWYRRLLGR